MSLEYTPTQLRLKQAHIERRLRIAAHAVRDRPINLKYKNGIVPEITVDKPVDKPKILPLDNQPVGPTDGNWPSLEPWAANAVPITPNHIGWFCPPGFHLIIRKIVADYFRLIPEELIGAFRDRERVIPRHIAMYFTKKYTLRSLPEIGRRFGNRDHSTVLHALRRIEKRMVSDPDIGQAVAEIELLLEDEINGWRKAK